MKKKEAWLLVIGILLLLTFPFCPALRQTPTPEVIPEVVPEPCPTPEPIPEVVPEPCPTPEVPKEEDEPDIPPRDPRQGMPEPHLEA